MSVGEAVLFWLSTFVQVFLLGFQSRNVNAGRYVSAAVTSAAIGASQIVVIRGFVQAEWWEVLALTGTAGPAAAVAAMLFSHHVFDKKTGGARAAYRSTDS